MKAITLKADTIGIFASTLCLIHCIATPFIFIAKTCSAVCCADAPIWWQIIDYLFLIISCSAIYFATKNSNKNWVKVVLWSLWALLALVIFSESLKINIFPNNFIYLPAFLIIAIHFYNQKYCKCTDDGCCAQLLQS